MIGTLNDIIRIRPIFLKKDGEKPKSLSPGMSLKLWEILDYIYIDNEEINIGPNGENFKRGKNEI